MPRALKTSPRWILSPSTTIAAYSRQLLLLTHWSRLPMPTRSIGVLPFAEYVTRSPVLSPCAANTIASSSIIACVGVKVSG